MRKFLKNNWFKIILLVLIAIFIFGYLYISIKEYNREVLHNIFNDCVIEFSQITDDKDMIEICTDGFKKLYIFKFLIKK